MSSTISAYRDNHCKYYFCVCSFLSGKHTCTHTHDLDLHIDMYICVCVCTIIIFYKHQHLTNNVNFLAPQKMSFTAYCLRELFTYYLG